MPRQEQDTGFGYVVREMARHVGVVFLVGATVATVASQITPDALLPRGVRLGISIAKGAAAQVADAAEPTPHPPISSAWASWPGTRVTTQARYARTDLPRRR